MNSTTVGGFSTHRENSHRIHSASHRRLGLGFNFAQKRTNLQENVESKKLFKKKTVPGSGLNHNLAQKLTTSGLQEHQHPYEKFKLKVQKLTCHNLQKKNSYVGKNDNSLFQNFSIIAKTNALNCKNFWEQNFVFLGRIKCWLRICSIL